MQFLFLKQGERMPHENLETMYITLVKLTLHMYRVRYIFYQSTATMDIYLITFP